MAEKDPQETFDLALRLDALIRACAFMSEHTAELHVTGCPPIAYLLDEAREAAGELVQRCST